MLTDKRHSNSLSCVSVKMVGLVRFELTTSCTPCKRATKLRYSPNFQKNGQKAECHLRKQAVFFRSSADACFIAPTDATVKLENAII